MKATNHNAENGERKCFVHHLLETGSLSLFENSEHFCYFGEIMHMTVDRHNVAYAHADFYLCHAMVISLLL